MISTKVPAVGQEATQEPDERNEVASEVHERQSVLAAPLHVPHDASHGSHMLLEFENLPTGVHEARHEPGASRNG